MDQHIGERLIPGKFKCAEDHPCHPEVDNIISGHQNIVRVIPLIVAAVLIRPAQRCKRPQVGAEPGVQNILILSQIVKAADSARFLFTVCNKYFPCGFGVPGRNAVAPPQLAGDAPVADVLNPVQIGFLKTFRYEVDAAAVFLGSNRLLGQRLHLYEPLGGQIRLDYSTGTLAVSHLVHMVLN
ncbi:hypothetical protein D3C73_607910 [compost metagenome]